MAEEMNGSENGHEQKSNKVSEIKKLYRSNFVPDIVQDIKGIYPDLSKTKLEDIVDRALKEYDTLKKIHVEAGDEVIVQGWGKYYQSVLAGRKGRNFRTKQMVNFPTVGVARFKAAFSIPKPAKKLLNKHKE
jgi:nucleoid DNA-binding protein